MKSFLLWMTLLAVVTPAIAAGIPWTDKINPAFEESAVAGKPIFVDVWAVWCVPCERMDQTTYRDPAIVEAMSGFVALRVDHDSAENFCERYDVEALPLVLYLDADGQEIGRREGFLDSAQLLTSMATVRSGYAAYREAADVGSVADYLARAGNPGRAIALLRRAIKDATAPREREELELGLAEAELAGGEAKAAAAGFRQLADGASEPELRGRALAGLVRALRERGRDEEAAATLELLRQEFPALAAGE